MNLFLAKTKDEKTIVEHTEDLLFYYDAFKEEVENKCSQDLLDIIKLAVIYHDIGKVNRRFQNKLYRKLDKPLLAVATEAEEIPHGYLSPAYMDLEQLAKMYDKDLLEILVTAIVYHHARQPLDNPMKREIKRLTVEELSDDIEGFVFNRLTYYADKPKATYVKLSDSMLSESPFIKGKMNPKVRDYVFVKGTLNKLDYLASGLDRTSVYNYPLAEPRTGKKIDALVKEVIKGQGFDLRKIQDDLYAHRHKSGVVIASTGMGKTEAALLWLSDKKGIFTLPLKVSIDAIYRRVKNVYNYSPVELVHSSMEDIYLQEQDALLDHRTRMSEAKLLTAPLTITTIDQVFKFIFLYNGFEITLSTLMQSKVVIDEIQMYDSQLIACLIYGIKMIYHYGGQFLIMTATLPPYIRQLLIEQGIPMDELYEETYLLSDEKCARRHLLALTGQTLDLEKILEQGKSHKVLVIVNTVKKAQELYRQLCPHGTIRLLHSNFIKKDRRVLEQGIQSFTNDSANEGKNGIWIATQIVEASLDIDFDILHTEMCAIDSFIQRIGRVYRRRYEWTGEMPNVYVANTRNTGGGKVIDIDMYETSYKVLGQYNGKWLTEVDKQAMMTAVFDDHLYPNMKKFKSCVKLALENFSEYSLYGIDKKTIKSLFRDIDNETCMPFACYHQLVQNGTLEALSHAYYHGKTPMEKIIAKNTLLDYTLSIRANSRNLQPAGEKILQDFHIFICDRVYDFDEASQRGEGLTLALESDDVFL